MTLKRFYGTINKSWTKSTTHKNYTAKWSADVPSTGQCAVTALLVNDYFGGEIYTGFTQKGERHFWNIVQGHKVDLTRAQLPDDVEFHKVQQRTRASLLKIPDLKYRYLLLKKNFEDNLAAN